MLAVQTFNGLMEGMMLFLIASGLTLIFGVSRIINFAHGSLYMLGAFLTYQLTPHLFDGSLSGFIVAVLFGASCVAIVGLAFERLALRRIYQANELMQLIITVALVLIIRDVVRFIWGANDVNLAMPSALSGAIKIGNNYFPVFQFAIFGAGLFVLVIMVIILKFTRAGVLLRAATDDRGMVALLGINQHRIFALTFTAGAFLAGLAGGLAAPFGNVNYLADTGVIVEAFIVCVIGGLGNLYGALAGALAIGILKALGVLYFPRMSAVLIFLIMAVVLIIRSLGRQEISK
ncbi:MAG: branched-chain amino acid ABC transporter permease [Fimbriimonadaceae bacterium]|nr:branched-chain amino acid ABC transporter permease [Alphaproteobacteria bacterium]